MRCVIALFLLVMGSLSAQREAANWYFGKNAGLTFNSGESVVLEGGQINTVEGCEAFSDPNGNLLFYTDGKTVWNRNHQMMPNGTGLAGSFSTSQSALVVPNPTSNNVFYVFTPDDALSQTFEDSSNGFNYSIIDMTRDSGKGDVINKNVSLLAQCSEKVSAVRNVTNDYYWVVTHYRDRFYAYRVDGSGVSSTPVISSTGPDIDNFENIRGSLKISPDGSKLAIAHTIVEPRFEGSFYLFDFDVETGVVSNPQLLSDERVYYGVEFSSNSTKLYASGMNMVTVDDERLVDDVEIVQFDLLSSDISSSEFLVGRIENNIQGVFVAGALQIAIDKKIYHSFPNSNLSVIRTPNLGGLDSDFRRFAVDLGDGEATYGLPPFIQSFFETIVTIENFCEGDLTTFTTSSSGAIDQINWNFGDVASGAANFSTDVNPTHIFSDSGVYTITIDVEYSNGSSRTFIEFVEIAEVPNVVQQVELVQCDSDGLDDGISVFNLNEAISLFNNGNQDITGHFFHTVSDAQANINVIDPIGYQNTTNGEILYARAFENAECFEIVEVQLLVEPLSDLGYIEPLDICNGILGGIATVVDITDVHDQLALLFEGYDSISLYQSQQNTLLELEKLELAELTFGPFDPLEVHFRLENANACDFVGSVRLNVMQRPEFEEVIETTLCGGTALLKGIDGFETYHWPDGSFDQEWTVSETGSYELIFGNGQCSYTQTFIVSDTPSFEISNIQVNDFRKNNSVEIEANYENGDLHLKFSIDEGQSFQDSPIFSRLAPGIYDIVVSDGCSELYETVLVGGAAPYFSPNNDGVNDIWTLANSEYFPRTQISIFDRYGRLLKTFASNQDGWDGTFNNRQMPATDYWYKLEFEEGRVVTGHFALKR